MFGSVPVFVISAILLAGRSYALSIAQFAIASLNTLLAAEMTVHPKTVSRHAGKWRVGIVSLLCCGISVCGYQIVDQHKKEEDQKKKDSDTKQALVNITNIFKRELSETVLVMKKEMDERIGGVIRDFSTNNTTDPNVKVAILESQKHPAEQALEDLKKEHELFDLGTADVSELRRKFKNELAQQEAKMRLVAISKEEEQIKAQQAALENAVMVGMVQQQDELRKTTDGKKIVQHIAPTMDYAIVRANTVLSAIAKESDKKLQTDFSGVLPTIYGSDLMSNGLFTAGNNFIRIGTNLDMQFNFSITTKEGPNPKLPVGRLIGLRISCEEANHPGQSVTLYPRPQSTTNDVKNVQIELKLTNGLEMSRRLMRATNAIDEAIDKLIFTQEQRSFQLSIRTNK